jgi:hypothetical protein
MLFFLIQTLLLEVLQVTPVGVGGSSGIGQYQNLCIADIDDEYLVHPGYGVITYDSENYVAGSYGPLINYENNSNTISWVSPESGYNNKAASIKSIIKELSYHKIYMYIPC